MDDKEDDIFAVWRPPREDWFQDSRPRLTVLGAPLVERSGIRSLITGDGSWDASLA